MPIHSAPLTGHERRWSQTAGRPVEIRTVASGGLGLLLILAGGYFLVRWLLPEINLGMLWPVVVMGLGVLLVIGAFLGRRSE